MAASHSPAESTSAPRTVVPTIRRSSCWTPISSSKVQSSSSSPLPSLIEAGCRVWLAPEPFDHSKLMVVDDLWTLIGSANWDTRSFRLNFELNVELHDRDFACQMALVAPTMRRLTLAELDADPLLIRLRNSAARLLQPYL